MLQHPWPFQLSQARCSASALCLGWGLVQAPTRCVSSDGLHRLACRAFEATRSLIGSRSTPGSASRGGRSRHWCGLGSAMLSCPPWTGLRLRLTSPSLASCSRRLLLGRPGSRWQLLRLTQPTRLPPPHGPDLCCSGHSVLASGRRDHCSLGARRSAGALRVATLQSFTTSLPTCTGAFVQDTDTLVSGLLAAFARFWELDASAIPGMH